jgi:hypothetical protein
MMRASDLAQRERAIEELIAELDGERAADAEAPVPQEPPGAADRSLKLTFLSVALYCMESCTGKRRS